MIHNSVSMLVLIRNTHQAREYRSPLNQQTYIEGRDGSDFIIRLTNLNNFRVMAIPSVDGLSVVDGKPAGSDSNGYLLDPNQIMDIPGWKVDGDTAAKFVFASAKGGSYTEQQGGDPVNKGVIGLMVFREKYTPLPYNNSFSYTASPFRGFGGAVGGITSSINVAQSSSAAQSYMNNATLSASTATSNASSATAAQSAASAAQAQAAAIPTMGTAFGEATTFATKEVDFQKGDLLATLVLFYGSAQFLKTKGIEVAEKNSNPFPANKPFCQPPTGWKR